MGPVADVLAVGGRATALLSGESPGTGWDALPVPLPLVLYTHSSAPLFYRCVGRVSAYLSAVLQAAVAARNDK